jgi:hypothetical protein
MSKEHLSHFIGFGVAGNFADHLDQAGEARDFVNVITTEKNAPKGMFPFYLPKDNDFLGVYPLSNKELLYPTNIGEGNLQMEPEIAIICELVYSNEKVVDIIPNYFTAYNDCSIRKQNAKKISEKKNWGERTKGISSQIIPIDKFEKGGVMDNYYIASFLKRDGKIYAYGNNSAALSYNYFYKKLKLWMIDKLNNQEDFGPLENLYEHLKHNDFPNGAIFSIGATSYTHFGENTFLQSGDEIYICVYNIKYNSYEEILNNIVLEKEKIDGASLLHQIVI